MSRSSTTEANIRERFDRKWRLDPVTGCYLWTGSVFNSGYGETTFNGKRYTAHRIAWFLKTGIMPTSNQFVCHSCDVRVCVNPDHLFLGTHQDNMDDMWRKGRGARVGGELHSRVKLTDTQVSEIRNRFDRGGVTQTTLALEYGVHSSHICRLVNRKLRVDPTPR